MPRSFRQCIPPQTYSCNPATDLYILGFSRGKLCVTCQSETEKPFLLYWDSTYSVVIKSVVSLTGDTDVHKSVVIKSVVSLTGDTDVHKCVVIKSVVSLTGDTDVHKSVLVACIKDIGRQSLPLHRLSVNSKYVTGTVTVSIVEQTPNFVQTWPDSECSHTVQFLDSAVLRL